MKWIPTRTEKHIYGVTEQAMEQLTVYSWPGNVRELINVLEYAFVVCHEELVGAEHLPPQMLEEPGLVNRRGNRVHEQERREELINTLEKTRGNKLEAASLLGVSRVALWKLLKKHGINVQARIESDS